MRKSMGAFMEIDECREAFMEWSYKNDRCGEDERGSTFSDEEWAAWQAAWHLRQLDPSWQPIVTAPQDGTRVLLYQDDSIGCGSWEPFDFDGADKPIAYEWQWDGDGFTAYPTHWMPLPKPPECEEV